MDPVKRWFLKWAGSSQMDEKFFQAIMNEFKMALYMSGVFLDLRPKYRIYSVTLFPVAIVILTLYIWCGLITCKLQSDDFTSAALTVELAIVIGFSIMCLVLFNINRQDVIHLIRFMSVGFYDYEDNEEIMEIVDETKKSKKQRIFVMLLVPAYLSVTAVTAVSGRTMDFYAGVASNSSYINDVYMLTPVPLWYPFKVSNEYWHYLAVLSQVVSGGIVACFYIGVMCLPVISLQNIVLQFKILILRIRKIQYFALKLHINRGGCKMSKAESFADHNFRACYNECLNKCAAHHAIIIRSFNHLKTSCKWFIYFGILIMSISVAMALLLLILGGKPSVLSLGLMILVVDVINIAILCWQSDQVQTLASGLHEELYNTDWRLVDKPGNRTLMIMIERCKQRLSLEAAVTRTPLNWETFSMILNSSYSYMNLLLALNA